jgi:hypothetical protein
MKNTITVRVTNNFGNKAIYPVCETSINLAKLAKTETLTPSAIETIKKLGYVIEIQQQTL